MWIQSIWLPTNCRACPLHPKDRRASCVSLSYHNLLSCLVILTWWLLPSYLAIGGSYRLWKKRIDTRRKIQLIHPLISSLLRKIGLSSRLWRTIPFNLKCFMSQACLYCPCKEAAFLRHSLAKGTGDMEEPRPLYPSLFSCCDFRTQLSFSQ